MKRPRKKPSKMPSTVYLNREPDEGYLIVSENLKELLSSSEDDGQTVGVYELVDVKKVSIKKSLEP